MNYFSNKSYIFFACASENSSLSIHKFIVYYEYKNKIL